jgi:chromosome segregation ATPase
MEKSAGHTIASQKETISRFESERKDLLKQIQGLRDDILQLKAELNQVQESGDDRVLQMEAQHQATIQQLKSEFAKDRTQLNEESAAKAQKHDNLLTEVRKLEGELAEHKRNARVLKASDAAKDNEIRDLLWRLNHANSEWNSRIEKEQFRAQYESLLETLKQKNKELRNLCSKTNESIAQTERHNQELLRWGDLVERENEQLHQKMESAKEEVAREQQLVETKAKATEIRNEMRTQAEIDDLKAAFESEKRTLFAFIANHFNQFFDGRQTQTAQSFKSVVVQARAEIERLRKADAAVRRLLCLTANDSTEEAVAELLLSLYRH